MIVISAGMQKAGTGWSYNMINDLLVASGHQDARKIREQYNLHSILKHANCNMGKPTLPKLIRLSIPHWEGKTFAVKTHKKPDISLDLLLRAGWIVKAIYTYRDPRDVAVSAFNHGKRLRSYGETHTFAKLTTLEDAIRQAQKHINNWAAWQRIPNTFIYKYEDMQTATTEVLEQISKFLDLKVTQEQLVEIILRYDKTQLKNDKKSMLHLDKGISGHFREAMNQEQIDLCTEVFGSYLKKMDYEI